MRRALFEGLVKDSNGALLPVAYVGQEPTYVLIEDGFKYTWMLGKWTFRS